MPFEATQSNGCLVIIRWSKAGAVDERKKLWTTVIRNSYPGTVKLLPAGEDFLTDVWAFPKSSTLENIKKSVEDVTGRYDKVVIAHPHGTANGRSRMMVHRQNIGRRVPA